MRQRPAAELGTRLLSHRTARGLSRRAVAELVGRSEEWLRQVETGVRRLDSIDAAVGLARVLQIPDMASLLGFQQPPPKRTERHIIVHDLCRVIVERDAWRADDLPQVACQDISAGLDALWQAWHHSPHRYSRIAGQLPGLLRNLRRDGDRGLLVSAYQLSRSFLARLGERRVSAIAADRGMSLAEGLDDPITLAVAARSLAMAQLQAAEPSDAFRFATGVAARLSAREPEDRDQLVIWGSLHSLAAKSATRMQDAKAAQSHLLLAERAAAALGSDAVCQNVYFGPSDIAITTVHLAIVAGETARALRLADTLTVSDDCPPAYLAGHLINVALAHMRRRQDAAAAFALLRVEQTCAEEIAHDRMVAAILRTLVRRPSALARGELERLARLAGVA